MISLTLKTCRSPHGERGLKSAGRHRIQGRGWSLSSWRAWIEIAALTIILSVVGSLSSWRAWIEIPLDSLVLVESICRSPHGERGLKWLVFG